MKSPFPGMDPYLEQHWRDVHASLVIYARDQLQPYLPPDLRARVEERVLVEPGAGDESRSIYPDVRIVHRPGREAAAQPESNVAVAKPLVIELGNEPATDGYIEIVEAGSGHRVITVIEFLSESNKWPGSGQLAYLKKRDELNHGGVSMVEVDLLREGECALMVSLRNIPPSHRTPYLICVRRAWRPLAVELYRAPLRQRLPTINVPLRRKDKDVPLDLQALIEQCYERGRYDDIDYSVPPLPPLHRDDAAWAAQVLRRAARK